MQDRGKENCEVSLKSNSAESCSPGGLTRREKKESRTKRSSSRGATKAESSERAYVDIKGQ